MNIAVYCSSSNHIAEKYIEVAYQLGTWIAQRHHVLVFGGATGGSMLAVSQGVFDHAGHIVGVIPQAVVRMNRQSLISTELITVETMDARKALMKEKSDAFVILPGSYGTMDELFDVIASGVVGEHKKQVIVLNQDGFYDDIIRQTKRMREEMFIPAENFKPIFVDNIEQCIHTLETINSI
ncbi:MAG: Rossman fold protein, TIGR00730 family [Porphyromonadaceae bacterium CG2_30_38_12]|nr:MAG: Rossman fold protein, TIGR00730 family [Porphyromonadaceae bacterium CG2_30_38_12]